MHTEGTEERKQHEERHRSTAKNPELDKLKPNNFRTTATTFQEKTVVEDLYRVISTASTGVTTPLTGTHLKLPF